MLHINTTIQFIPRLQYLSHQGKDGEREPLRPQVMLGSHLFYLNSIESTGVPLDHCPDNNVVSVYVLAGRLPLPSFHHL